SGSSALLITDLDTFRKDECGGGSLSLTSQVLFEAIQQPLGVARRLAYFVGIDGFEDSKGVARLVIGSLAGRPGRIAKRLCNVLLRNRFHIRWLAGESAVAPLRSTSPRRP